MPIYKLLLLLGCSSLNHKTIKVGLLLANWTSRICSKALSY